MATESFFEVMTTETPDEVARFEEFLRTRPTYGGSDIHVREATDEDIDRFMKSSE